MRNVRTATVSGPVVALDPDVADVTGTAFEAAWAALHSSGPALTARQASNARIRLARAILDGVQAGERDSARLRDRALSSLAVPDTPRTPGRMPYL
jgi:hypothetical protein